MNLDIRITNLYKAYRRSIYALKDVNLTIKPGMFGLLGPNGAGKTTLMRILSGLILPSAGDALIYAHSIKTEQGRQAVRAILGYSPQELNVHPYLTPREFLSYVGVLKGIKNPNVRQKQVNEILELMHLTDVSNRQIRTFSGGMKRRVSFGQALIGNPRLLIVDEPTVGLDPEERLNVRNILSQISKESTVILSTHIIEDVSQTCQKLAILSKGQVLFQGDVSTLVGQLEGKVYLMTVADGSVPANVEVISMIPISDGIQYRVVGENLDGPTARPTLEDAYIYATRVGGI